MKNRTDDLNYLTEPEKNRTDFFVSLTEPKLTLTAWPYPTSIFRTITNRGIGWQVHLIEKKKDEYFVIKFAFN